VAVKHAFVSGKADDADATLVNPSDWDAAHAVEAAGFEFGSGGPTIGSGSGDPEGSLTAPVGSLYLRTTGLLYMKETGAGNTGWVVMVSAD